MLVFAIASPRVDSVVEAMLRKTKVYGEDQCSAGSLEMDSVR